MSRVATPARLAPVNIYTDPGYLDALAEVYFDGRDCQVRDHVVGGAVYRLLVVEGVGPVTRQTFLDLHEPLGAAARGARGLARLPRLAGTALDAMTLEACRQRPGWEDALGAPTILWSGFAAWSDYLQLLRTRKVAAEDQRRGRRLRDLLGELEFRVDDRAADVLPTCYAWKSARDLELGRPDLFATDANRRFFPALRARGLLRASTLRASPQAGGGLLAVWLGAVYRGRWSGWIFSFNPDPAYAKFSPGRQLLYPMLEESHRSGHAEFDFSIGMEAYKLHFATHVRPIGLAGAPPPAERLAVAMRDCLRHSPWCYRQARALRHWLVAAPPAPHPGAATAAAPGDAHP